MSWKSFLSCLFVAAALVAPRPAGAAQSRDATAIVKAAIDYWRDTSSYAVSEMTIHRPEWERRMTLRVWTQGEEQSLVRVAAPPKDEGNATLLLGDEMWTYNPKINRVIKIPSSMMHQSWMGSDFSNSDLAKADDLVDQYTHVLLRTETQGGHETYVIEATPKPAAPVVWGREVVTIRDDWILLEHRFYDQGGELVKRLATNEIAARGGKRIATRQRMQQAEAPGEWTELRVLEADFGIDVPASTFTLANLRNPR